MTGMKHLERVAIVGAGGHIGRPITTSLLQSGKHSLTALTRPGSTTALPPGIDCIEVDYTDHPSLVATLKSRKIQFLIITLSTSAPPDTHTRLVRAASEAGVPYIMPNVYGGDLFNEKLAAEDQYTRASLAKCKEIEALGNTAFIALSCSFWFEWSLARGETFFGFDVARRKVTFYDDGLTRIATSTLDQCGRAVAGLLALPEDTIAERFKNGAVYVASFTVCQREILDSLHGVLGTRDEDWEIRYQGSKERYEEGLKELGEGNGLGFIKALYARGFFPGGGGDFEASRGLHNGLLGLEKEKLDDAVRVAVALVESGWTP
ncbi:Pinoresinol reductase 2 [Madurella mycetomatis]|uniref:Pinoresinol reductase 2 n=1 Tax=Madurella mycetomatis TaxID=100816 RepID=A0A175WCW9_9PEZI|nr:Pinoresinol reductase 2 [Madurella mycetomatis]